MIYNQTQFQGQIPHTSPIDDARLDNLEYEISIARDGYTSLSARLCHMDGIDSGDSLLIVTLDGGTSSSTTFDCLLDGGSS